MIFAIKIKDQIINWAYTKENQEKQFHLTWIPKLKDIEVITKDLKDFTAKEVKRLILEEMQPDIQMVKDNNNAKARARRLLNNE